jgi:thiamine-phosphate pyrophosphorylase
MLKNRDLNIGADRHLLARYNRTRAMLLYYITDRTQFSGTDADQRAALLRSIAAAALAGVDYIQLREKDLTPRELERLARDAVKIVRENSQTARLLINGRTDIALASGADGVHLPGGDLPASEVRALWTKCTDREPVIGVSSHSAAEIRYAEAHGATFAVLAPIFEKLQASIPTVGLAALREACAALASPGDVEAPYRGGFCVLALGGVTLANAEACAKAGAAGVAGIRVFQSRDVGETVRKLRDLRPSSMPPDIG